MALKNGSTRSVHVCTSTDIDIIYGTDIDIIYGTDIDIIYGTDKVTHNLHGLKLGCAN